jgi:DUF1365 family protein
MNSCLYKALVMHNRLSPKKHRFHYNVFMFYVDLDEVEMLGKKLWMFSTDRFNFFSLRRNEHLQLPLEAPDKTKSIREQISLYLQQNGIEIGRGKIMLLTNMNVLGYNFNPVSFYFCFDEGNKPLCAVAEVGNTFGEMKPYLLSEKELSGNVYHLNTTKYFYVSPFIAHDTNFDFNLAIPAEKLNIRIDDLKDGERFFISTLTGTRKALSNLNLLLYSIRFPFITLKIITLIHWNALLLWMKKLPFQRKSENRELQRDVYRRTKD